MEEQRTSDEPVTVTTRIPVKYVSRQIALDAIVTDVGTWAFRVQHEYSDKQIESLAEEIKLAGLLVPLVVAEASAGKYSLRDGFRRWHAMMMLVRTGEAGWSRGRTIDVLVIANEPDHVQDLLRVGAINVQRNTWGDTALVRYCKAVADAGVSSAELARVIGRSPKHTTRYLKLAGVAWLLEHVEKHHIAMTTAISLLETDHAGRFDELRLRIDAWVREVNEEIAAENVKRRNQGKKELSGRDLWPAKKLRPSQVDAWKRGLSTGDWTTSAGLLKESLVQDGKVRVAGKSIDVAKADLRQLIALYESLGKTVADLEPLLLQKKAEQEAKADTSARADHRVSERLAELGIERPEEDGPTEVDGEVDEDFGGGPAAEEVDYSSTVELPEDGHHAAGFSEGSSVDGNDAGDRPEVADESGDAAPDEHPFDRGADA